MTRELGLKAHDPQEAFFEKNEHCITDIIPNRLKLGLPMPYLLRSVFGAVLTYQTLPFPLPFPSNKPTS